jgi:branched-chain amino acid transport system ATP-binding protein
MTETSQVVLDIADLHAWYGESKALHGMNFDIREGELVTLLGRNGAGKTTALRCIMGLVRKKTGVITYRGENVATRAPEIIARRGIAYCPEERGIFSSLSVAENLELPPVIAKGGMTVDEILELFPNLKARWQSPGTKLSGGEQQMLAIGRILRTGAKLLIFDEPTEGLAPVIVKQIAVVLEKLKARGFTILLVEQNFRFASTVADRYYVMEHGRIIDGFANSELEANMGKLHEYLGV